MSKWKVFENIETRVLHAAEVFVRRQREKVAKSMEGLYLVVLGVEFNHLRGYSGFQQLLYKEEEVLKGDVIYSLDEDGVLCVSWQINNKTHWAFIPPGEQALVDRNRHIVRTFFDETESFVWLNKQVLSCNVQLQNDKEESSNPDFVM